MQGRGGSASRLSSLGVLLLFILQLRGAAGTAAVLQVPDPERGIVTIADAPAQDGQPLVLSSTGTLGLLPRVASLARILLADSVSPLDSGLAWDSNGDHALDVADLVTRLGFCGP